MLPARITNGRLPASLALNILTVCVCMVYIFPNDQSNVLSLFAECIAGLKMWPLRVFTRLFYVLTYFLTPIDPVLNLIEILLRTSFWASLKLIRLKMWPLECSQGFSMIWSCDLFFEPHDRVSNLSEILSRTSLWASLKLIGLKMWPLECSQGFSMIWSSDLLFDPTWSSFKLEWDFVKDIIVSKFEVD